MEYQDFAVALAKDVGDRIHSAFFDSSKSIEIKSCEIDLVTKTDQEVEKIIIDKINSTYPEHRVLGEESYDGSQVLTNEPTWIIDPVDGTSNFVHGLPMVCVSIALVVDKQPILGVVYNPIIKELFRAVKGMGAFLNDKRIHVSKAHTLSVASIATEVGYDRTPEGIAEIGSRLKLLLEKRVQCIRALGTCAINMAYVACGRLDAYGEGRNTTYGPKPWDMAAGALLVLEAGGVLTGIYGDELDLSGGHLLACATSSLHKEFLDCVLQSRSS